MLVAEGLVEGEELQTNLLQASQRIPASSGALDEVFGTTEAAVTEDGYFSRCFGTNPSFNSSDLRSHPSLYLISRIFS